ncbi:S8 family serine peptidase [Dyadobacter alkalitolerans]|uniref:S8 family serine peptidase n=1 Tax=Dyadobacter alkalitolerans TaxID=492736 RepID=UPI000402D6BB|nr:S8 family serine peptidase [Dyadobacter alkalitolerans]
MKQLCLPILLLVLLSGFSQKPQQEESKNFYWYGDRKISLKINENDRFIVFDESAKMESGALQLVHHSVLGEGMKGHKAQASKRNITWARINSEQIDKIDKTNILYDAPSFYDESGKLYALSSILYVKLKGSHDIAILEKMAEQSRVEIIGSFQYMPLWYALSCNKQSVGNSLEIANKFHDSGEFSASEPELLGTDDLSCTTDPSFGSQWYLKNTGQNSGNSGSDIKACEAWASTKGCSNVIVALVDNGVQKNHPDITNLLPGYNAENATIPQQDQGEHGTEMAGIIGAAHNSTGISGIAPNCKILPISLNFNSQGPGYLEKRADGILWAANAGNAWIISNSWQSPVNTAITDAINYAVANGRGGLGCVVVFSSGNKDGNLEFPATLPNVLSVGATKNTDERWSEFGIPNGIGSAFGTGLDVVAPGVNIYTTTRTSTYKNVTATSPAAAIVSGIAALVLAANPSLTQLQVRQIIESTTDKSGGYSYTLGSGENTSLSWTPRAGYGRVNAFKAVQKAQGVIIGPDVFCSTASFSLNGAPSGSITWSTDSPTNVSINSSGLATRHFDRVVTIRANVATSSCGVKQLTKRVTAGPPSYSLITAESGYIGTGQRIINLCNLPTEAEAAYSGPGLITGYEWKIQDHSNWDINNRTPNGKIVEIDYWQSPAFNPQKIYIRAQNTCGWGPYQETLWTIQNCFSAYIVYPNPAEKYVTIEFEDLKNQNSLPDKIELFSTSTEKPIVQVNPREMFGKQQLEQGNKITIDVSSHKRGNYFLHVTKGKDVEKRQVVLK